MLFRFLAQIAYTAVMVLETLISIRFVLKLINVAANVPLVSWLYTFTDHVLSPFTGIVQQSVTIFGLTVELTTLLVIFILSLCSYALHEIIKAYSA